MNHGGDQTNNRSESPHFEQSHQMTVGDMITYLSRFDKDLPVICSIFRVRQGLIYKQELKFSQLKRGRNCIYINDYLSR